MGPLTDAMKRRAGRRAGRHQVRHHVDDARRVSAAPRAEGRLAERRVVHRRRHHPRARGRPRRPRADAGRAGRCGRWCGRRWRRARSASARRSSTRRAFYAKTEELIELCKVAAQYQGKYISHMRSEGDRLLEAVDELIRISREAGLPAEIYHLKAAGRAQLAEDGPGASRMVEAARAEGLKITADMYTYTAGATGLDAAHAAVGAGRRLRRAVRAAARPGRRARRSARRSHAERRVGEPVPARPARPSACCSSASRPRR